MSLKASKTFPVNIPSIKSFKNIYGGNGTNYTDPITIGKVTVRVTYSSGSNQDDVDHTDTSGD